MSGRAPDVQDPTRVLDGWRAPTDAPEADLDLRGLLRRSQGLNTAKRERLKARGYDMEDVQDIDLPEASAAPPAPAAAPPRLDLAALRTAPADPHLLARWQPLAWTALARRVIGATADITQTPDGPRVDSLPPQWLCALWPPQSVEAPLLGRWPELAALVGADSAVDALRSLLPELPSRARLWLAGLDADWALIADLVRHQDASLRPVHAQALLVLADAERGASFARLNDGYARQGCIARRRA